MNAQRAEWIGLLTAVCVILGGLLALTFRTQQAISPGMPLEIRNSQDLSNEWQMMQVKILRLQNELSRIRNEHKGSPEWDRLSMFSDLAPVVGPGVIVTMSDSPAISGQGMDPALGSDINYGIIHDVDILRVVNDLFAAHAEAIAVNNQRVGPRTAIRCVGPVVNVNQVGLAPPFRVEAIGDPATLQGAMGLPGGVVQQLKGVGCIITVETAKKLMLPAFDGAVDFRYAQRAPTQPTPDSDGSSDGGQGNQ